MSVQVAAKEPDSRWQDGEEEEEDEEWLREIEEVAALFVSLVLEDQLAPQPLGGGKSPAATKPAAGVGRVTTASNAPEIARMLKGIGDEIDAKVHKEIEEATADLLRHRSVFQVGVGQFNGLCTRVLSRCSDVMTTGWEQVSTVYMTVSQMARQLDTAQPQGQPAGVVAGRFYRYSRQYMIHVGLDTWIQDHGGMATVLDASLSGEQGLDVVQISDSEL